MKYLEAAERVIEQEESWRLVHADDGAFDVIAMTIGDFQDSVQLATLIRELHALVTPDICECVYKITSVNACDEKAYGPIRDDEHLKIVAEDVGQRRRRLADFALAVVSKLEEST